MMQKLRQIIICGSNRSGSTSLFKYLSAHPKISSSNIKQTNFFLDSSFIEKGKQEAIYHHSTHPDDYLAYYNITEEHRYRLEASPDYMYSKGTPDRLKKYFDPEPLLIFILREPNDRLRSWFSFGKQIGQISPEETFDTFVEKSKKNTENTLKSYQAIETADYFKYLTPFYNTFSSSSIYTVSFDKLKSQPIEVIKDILQILDIEMEPYKAYEFKQFNASKTVKFRFIQQIYSSLGKKYRRLNIGKSSNKFLAKLAGYIKAIIFSSKKDTGHSTQEKKGVIEQKNQHDLEQLINLKLPW